MTNIAEKYVGKLKRFYFRRMSRLMMSSNVCMYVCMYVCRRRVCLINRGQYIYPFFNGYFIENMLSICMYSLARGYVPYICLDGRKTGFTNWDTFFRQPMGTTREMVAVTNDRLWGYDTYGFELAWNAKDLKRWCVAYHALVRYNDETKTYIEADRERILAPNDRVLGVLCRGTDYLTLQPKGHPRLPSIEDVLGKVKEVMEQRKYDKIYLATEDEKIERRFCDVFPNRIVVNRREHFSERLDNVRQINPNAMLHDVDLQRVDALYWRGLQYLSSMDILSRCDALIATNCGGTLLALLMNNRKYKYTYIFNLGVY